MSLGTIVLDFDGVIHSYTSGWKGPRVIPDPPVPGAIEFLLEAGVCYDIAVSSSRSHYWFGRAAMRNYIAEHMRTFFENAADYTSAKNTDSLEELEKEIDFKVYANMRGISFPKHKPPALLTIDDRAMTFKGEWPSMQEIKSFRPWYYK